MGLGAPRRAAPALALLLLLVFALVGLAPARTPESG